MKILHVNDTYALTGGIGRYLFEIMNLLEAYGHTNIVLYQRSHDRTVIDTRKTYLISENRGSADERHQAVKSVIDAEKPNVAMLHAAYDPAVVVAVTQSIPAIAYVHGFHAACPGLAKYFRRSDQICQRPFGLKCAAMIYARRCCDARHPRSVYRLLRTTARVRKAYKSMRVLLVASQYMRKLMIQNGFKSAQVFVLPYPLRPPHATSIDPKRPRRILFAGRLEIEKGVSYLLRAFAGLAAPCELRIAGDGTLRHRLEQLAADLGIGERTEFLGWLGDEALDHELQGSRAVVVPSICPEAFGQVGVQALLHGRPVVAFDVGGIGDWLTDGWSGFLVPPRDVEALRDRMELLLADPVLASEFGTRGREAATRLCDPEVHIGKLLEVLSEVDRGAW